MFADQTNPDSETKPAETLDTISNVQQCLLQLALLQNDADALDQIYPPPSAIPQTLVDADNKEMRILSLANSCLASAVADKLRQRGIASLPSTSWTPTFRPLQPLSDEVKTRMKDQLLGFITGVCQRNPLKQPRQVIAAPGKRIYSEVSEVEVYRQLWEAIKNDDCKAFKTIIAQDVQKEIDTPTPDVQMLSTKPTAITSQKAVQAIPNILQNFMDFGNGLYLNASMLVCYYHPGEITRYFISNYFALLTSKDTYCALSAKDWKMLGDVEQLMAQSAKTGEPITPSALPKTALHVKTVNPARPMPSLPKAAAAPAPTEAGVIHDSAGRKDSDSPAVASLESAAASTPIAATTPNQPSLTHSTYTVEERQLETYKKLCRAIANQKIEEVKALCPSSVAPNQVMDFGSIRVTPLIVAGLYNQKKIKEYLIQQGADLDRPVNVCENNTHVKAQTLFNGWHGQKIPGSRTDEDAARANAGFKLTMKQLQTRLETCLASAPKAEESSIKPPQKSRKKRRNKEAKATEISETHNNTNEQLLTACEYGDLGKVIAIANQSNVNIASADEMFPLYLACANGHLAIAQHLIGLGAEVEKAGPSGVTPLIIACQFGYVSIVQYLIEHCHANVETKTTDLGNTPLLMACQQGHLGVVKYLCEHAHANVESARENGTTPLSLACYKGHLEIVQYLTQNAGANVNATRKDGITPLYFAAQEDHIKIVRHLVENCKADINAKANNGKTPLDAAQIEGQPAVVEYLTSAVPLSTEPAEKSMPAIAIADKQASTASSPEIEHKIESPKTALSLRDLYIDRAQTVLVTATPEYQPMKWVVDRLRYSKPLDTRPPRDLLALDLANTFDNFLLFVEIRFLCTDEEVKNFLKNCYSGNLEEVSNQLLVKPWLVHCNYQGQTPIEMAIENNQQPVVRLLKAASQAPSNKRAFARSPLGIRTARSILLKPCTPSEQPWRKALATAYQEQDVATAVGLIEEFPGLKKQFAVLTFSLSQDPFFNQVLETLARPKRVQKPSQVTPQDAEAESSEVTAPNSFSEQEAYAFLSRRWEEALKRVPLLPETPVVKENPPPLPFEQQLRAAILEYQSSLTNAK